MKRQLQIISHRPHLAQIQSAILHTELPIYVEKEMEQSTASILVKIIVFILSEIDIKQPFWQIKNQ